MRFRSTVVAVLGLATFAACSDRAPITAARSASGDSGANLARIASVSVTLASASVAAGSTTQATANVRDVYGNSSSPSISWKSSNTAVATVSSTGLVKGVAAGSATISANVSTYYGTKSGSAALTVTAAGTTPPGATPPPSGTTAPGAVTTLAANGTGPSSVTLTFTQVSDGAGAAAKYDVRFSEAPLAWGSGASVTNGTCATPLAGTGTSGSLSCTVLGLSAGKTYAFQLVAFRGTLNVDAKFGALSNVASATTPASITSVPPAPLPTPTATTIAVSPTSLSLAIGATQNLSATVKDQSGAAMVCSSLAWSSSAPSIASVSSAGAVKGLAAGSASIKASCGTLNASSAVSVVAAPAVAVSSVTTSLVSSSLQTGQTTQASAITRDAAGNTLTGRTIAWSSSNTAVATVSSSGLVTSMGAGSASITATSEGKQGAAPLSVQAPVVATGAAPEPGTSATMLWQDAFNRSTGISSGYTTRGNMVSIPDGHSGQAIRFPYTASSWDNLIEKGFAQSSDVYVRYWYRTSVGADPTCHNQNQSGFKWFMLWRPDPNPRYTFGVHNLDENVNGRKSAGLEFSAHDNSLPDTQGSLQNVTTSPRFGTTNDGQWHKFTLHVTTGTGGYEKMWIDDVLIMDTSRYPTRNHSSVGLSMFQFPGTMVAWYSGCEFNLDIDDFVVWK